MKKSGIYSISIILFCLLALNCKESSEKKSEDQNTNEEIELTDKEALEDGEKLIIGVPSFDNSAVQEYVNSYEGYLKEYARAVENQDIEALSELGPKGQELSNKAQEISGNMSVEDAQKFTHYMTEKAKEIRELTLNMSK